MEKVGIDVRELCKRPAGKGQYVLRVLDCWVRDKSFPITLYIQAHQELPQSIQEEIKKYSPPGFVTVIKQVGKGPLWHRAVAKRLKEDGVTVFFAGFSYQSALWNTIPTVTVVHDLAIFKNLGVAHNKRAELVERLTLQLAIKRSKKIITISESTKKDLLEMTHIDPQKISLAFAAPLLNEVRSGVFIPLPLAERKPYFLYVGTLEPRKNITAILHGYAGLPAHLRAKFSLKLAGKKGWGKEDYPGLAKKLAIEDRVEFLGYVSDAERFNLLKNAVAFIYPSLYEGFGMPPIEAMAVGTPVIASNTSSLPEVVGDSGFLCDPHDYAAITRSLEKIVSDPKAYEQLSQKALQKAQEFKWEASAAIIADALLY